MRLPVLTAFILLIPALLRAQEATQNKASQPRDQLPAATAEPDNASAYAPPEPIEREGPTAADIGPAQQHFVLANMPDSLALEDDPPTIRNLPVHKVALDPKIKISLIHDVENDAFYRGAENHALLFEIKYINWGAVTEEQLNARHGHYFTISWVNRGPRDNFTACFQYREVKSKEIVRTLEEPMNNVKGTVRSYFAVVGKAYRAYGPVESWRFTILRQGTVVAEAKSNIW